MAKLNMPAEVLSGRGQKVVGYSVFIKGHLFILNLPEMDECYVYSFY